MLFRSAQSVFHILYQAHQGKAIPQSLPLSYSAVKSYNKGEGITLPTVQPYTREGYRFTGWYDQLNGGNKVDCITAEEAGDRVLYAQWRRQSREAYDYNLAYKNDHGKEITESLPQEYILATSYEQGQGLIMPTVKPS